MSSSEPSPPIIDTHTHLDEPSFDADRAEVLQASRAAGVSRFINIGYKPERWESSRKLREEHPDVDFVLGLHPQEAASFGPDLDRKLRQAISDLQPIAVGETGFDFARSGPSRRQQERAFRGQIEIATAERLPIIIHQRDAADALMSELDRWAALPPIVFHSFDGNQRLADWAVERDCYIGIGGLACKRASVSLRELLADMPIARLLLETDSPYLAPPGASDRRNIPANLPLISDLLAPLWNLTGQSLCQIATANAEALFGFKSAGQSLE